MKSRYLRRAKTETTIPMFVSTKTFQDFALAWRVPHFFVTFLAVSEERGAFAIINSPSPVTHLT